MASRIQVLVATTAPDLKASFISDAVARHPDMTLTGNRILASDEIQAALAGVPPDAPAALIVVGRDGLSEDVAARWLAQRRNLVVLGVDIVGDLILAAIRDPGMESLLAALRDLVVRADPTDRFGWHRLCAGEQPLLQAGIAWAHALLRRACARLIDARPDRAGATVTTAAIADLLDARPALTQLLDTTSLEAALDDALRAAADEPLAVLAAKLDLSALEFRMVVLALAPELDARHQRWIGLLMDDLTRRTGTLGLYAELLGEPSQVRRQLAQSGNLARWRIFEGGMPAADEPLRLDPALKALLLGDAPDSDTKLRRVLSPQARDGAKLLEAERDRALAIVKRAQGERIVLASAQPPLWRALVELGADALGTAPLRIDLAALQGWEPGEIEDVAVRLTRLGLVTGRPLVADIATLDEKNDAGARLFFDSAGNLLTIASDPARAMKLMGTQPCTFEASLDETSLRLQALRTAAQGADLVLDTEAAEEIASLFPLQVDGFEQAMRLARLGEGPARERFLAACKQVSAESTSRLAERIEPEFTLDDVVLPADRKAQLLEIVDNVRLAAKVLDGWEFRRKLPYGRGVSALFHGPSGTGKTMAALAIARTLGVQVLRIDLSRVVSKYIGDTEKNIDRVFHDAQFSGAALLIDEADALMGKRSEVNDAHDRYANIEVAYLLQRMEAYEGLAILTTNLRQNLDAAFLRRLRFIVEFPRPDAPAREEIWRKCLPEGSYVLDDAALRQLARKIELTGGHVRQITLRAAFLAAAEDRKIGLEHLAHAARAEYAKLGLPPVDIDIPERRRAA